MDAYGSNFVAEVAPGLVIVGVTLVAGVPPYKLLRRFTRGRARTAIGYLVGLFTGLAATTALAMALLPFADASAVGEAGVFGALFGPFVGLARGRWTAPRRVRRRAAWAR
jgi:hypothetical protein